MYEPCYLATYFKGWDRLSSTETNGVSSQCQLSGSIHAMI